MHGRNIQVRIDPLARIVRGALLVVLVLYTASAFWRPTPGYDPYLDGVLRLTGHGLAAFLVALRPLRSRLHRGLWLWVAVAVGTRSLGVIAYAVLVRPLDPQPYPSLADGWWMLSYVALFVAIGLLAVARRGATSLPLMLDGVVVGLAVASVSVALLTPTIASVTADGTATLAAVATNLAYPLMDVMLLVVLLGVLAAGRGRRSPAVWGLAAGIATLAIVDVTFLQVTVTGGFGALSWLSPLSALSLGASTLLALAAWAPDHAVEPHAPASVPRLAAPVAGASVCLAVLVVATGRTLPGVAVAFATAGLAAAIARTGATFRILRATAEYRHAATTDDLTGIANRRVLNQALAERLEDGEVSLLVLDLDGFREVNDTYGHHHGDELLRVTAQRLAAAVRDQDLLARIGGDEFAVVMPGADTGTAAEVADRLLQTLRRPVLLGSVQVAVEASVGTASSPVDADEASELLRLADLAMYDAKDSGAGPRAYDRRRHLGGETRRRTVDELRSGIDRGEIELHYQPQVRLDTGEVVGVEALARWRHPREGLLPPSAFLPLAESSGLVHRLTIEVLERAATQAALWRAGGSPVTTAVNLSVSTMLDAAFPRHLEEVLASTGLPPSALTLELTEDLFVVDPDRAQRQISLLLERGSRLWVDDYGTGYSSLGYLRDLTALAGIKLDRSFVGCVDVDRRARAIVASTIDLADALDLAVIAEGVETEPVRDTLAALGCRTAQGFLFARPQPASELTFEPIATGRSGHAGGDGPAA